MPTIIATATTQLREGSLGPSDNRLFPMFLKLQGRRCVVVGGGAGAEDKIRSLLDTGAELSVIAPQVTAQIAEMATAGQLLWHRRDFLSSDLDDVFLVITGNDDRTINARVYAEAKLRGVLCNAVDDP